MVLSSALPSSWLLSWHSLAVCFFCRCTDELQREHSCVHELMCAVTKLPCADPLNRLSADYSVKHSFVNGNSRKALVAQGVFDFLPLHFEVGSVFKIPFLCSVLV